MSLSAFPSCRSSVFVATLTIFLVGYQSTSGARGELPRAFSGPQRLAQRVGKYHHSRSELADERKVKSQVALARSLERQGKIAEAIYAYSTALTFGERADVRHRMAVLYDKHGDFEKSEAHYREALRQDPHNAELLCDRGYSYFLQRRPTEAEEHLRKAIKRQPSLGRAHNNLGLVLAQQDRTDEALVEFAAAGCSHAEARTNLAFALMLSGDLAEAQYQLTLAQKANSSLQPAEELRAAISQLMPLAHQLPPPDALAAPDQRPETPHADAKQQLAGRRTTTAAPDEFVQQEITSIDKDRTPQSVGNHQSNSHQATQRPAPSPRVARSKSQPFTNRLPVPVALAAPIQKLQTSQADAKQQLAGRGTTNSAGLIQFAQQEITSIDEDRAPQSVGDQKNSHKASQGLGPFPHFAQSQSQPLRRTIINDTTYTPPLSDQQSAHSSTSFPGKMPVASTIPRLHVTINGESSGVDAARYSTTPPVEQATRTASQPTRSTLRIIK